MSEKYKYKSWEIEELEKRRSEQFFIAPDGKVEKWEGSLEELDDAISTHTLIAKKLYPNIDNPSNYLYNIGYIIVRRNLGGPVILNEPTQAQINTLYELKIRNLKNELGMKLEI